MTQSRKSRIKTHTATLNKDVVSNVDPIAYQKSLVTQHIEEQKNGLPHKYGWKWYRWAREFYESRNKINLLTAGNQASKSSSQIRKNIEWACNKALWPKLWPTNPRQFWYFYPSLDTATREFTTKWVTEFLPRGKMKDHQDYGWTAEFSRGLISSLHFNSGVTIFFMSYTQKISNLQASTVHMISGDEEMPPDFVDELMARLSATRGYFNLAFTATEGYELWYRAMECIGKSEEIYPLAKKWIISLYDCQFYEDNTPGHWSLEQIKQREASCSSKNEILRRVYGRFVRDEGRKFANFAPDKNMMTPTKVPEDWKYYAGVDIGSGGSVRNRSCGAVVIIAVNPIFTKGRVINCWRGDHEETTAGDILNKYRYLRDKLPMTNAAYDNASREFSLLASRSGEPFVKADKSHDTGVQTINLLYQKQALMIDEGVGDSSKLTTEMMSLPAGPKKAGFRDDLSDALRYCVQLIPWDFPKIADITELPSGLMQEMARDDVPNVQWTEKEYYAWEIRQRRGDSGGQRERSMASADGEDGGEQSDSESLSSYISEWNTQYGS